MLGMLAGCRGDAPYVVPTEPMPPNTVLLSTMMQQLSERPGFTEKLLAHLNSGGKSGPALLTPGLIDHMRKLILGKDWQGLNRFPGWTMREIDPTVRVAGHFVGRNEANGAAVAGEPAKEVRFERIGEHIDLGSYGLQHRVTVDLDGPSELSGKPAADQMDLGEGVVRGDGPDPQIAPLHAESLRLAYLLNRLSLNGIDGVAPAVATVGGHKAATPEDLVKALAESGHEVVVSDVRYFANFGHLHYHGQDVMMPFWVNSRIRIPHTNRSLLVPVSHAEYEWNVSGPKIHAKVAWYFGIDGRAEFRTMDERNQPWVMGRHAHEYRGSDAVEVTRLVGRMVVAYAHEHVARPELPFGGYYALGVCQDSVAAIEKRMTGRTTLFPNTADASLFDDPRDAEVNALIAAIPKDRNGAPPEPERIFGSLPTADLGAILIPGLAADLERVQTAWKDGDLERTHGWGRRVLMQALGGAGMLLVAGAGWMVWRRRRR